MKHAIRADRRRPVLSCGIVVLCCAWAFAGWRNMPRLASPAPEAAGTAIAISIAGAFILGRRSVKSAAIAAAVASAHAEARAAARSTSTSTSSSNVAVVVAPSLGAAHAGRERFGLEDAPWIVSTSLPAQLDRDEDEAVAIALEDVLEEREVTS